MAVALSSSMAMIIKVEPEAGVYLRPGQMLSVENSGNDIARFVSSQCPEETFAAFTDLQQPERAREQSNPIVRLADRRALPTADRWYRVLVDDEIGSEQVTQFVGSIPPGARPIIFTSMKRCCLFCVAKDACGQARPTLRLAPARVSIFRDDSLTASKTPGDGELRLLGIFYPAGSPAVRY
jgi:hypothetical protein